MPGSSSTASSRLPLGLPCNLRVGVPPADPPAVLLPRVLCHTPEALGLLPRVLCHTPGVRGLLLSPICSPCPNSHAWGRELGKGMSPVNSWGRSPRCPNSRTAISFLSCEDGKGEKKNSPLAFVLNSDQLLSSTVPLPWFLPHKAHSWAPSFQFSDVSDMNISVPSGTDHRFCHLSSKK